ncbi:MAG: aminotransferase class V-fold PLP-dependent enzyme [Candidatus Dojkabacteria bacterium]
MLVNKDDFPIFRNYPKLVYLDSAATSQKPETVLNAITGFYSTSNANVHRGIYELAEKSTTTYETARKKVAAFFNVEESNKN